MSWAEIKKAVNSDLDIPLNEQLKKYTCTSAIKTYVSPSSSTGVEDSFTVSSPCLLYAASVTTWNTSRLTSSIVVDGVTLGGLPSDSNNGSYSTTAGFISLPFWELYVNVSSALAFVAISRQNQSTFYRQGDLPVFVSTLDQNNTRKDALLVSPIVVKSSFSLSTSKGSVGCIYALI